MIVGALLPGAPQAWADNSESTSNRVLQMFGLGRGSGDGAKPAPTLAECPEIVVDGGGAELRAPPGADASSVRYQIAVTRTARECALVGNDISVKVGIMGSAVLGPVGQPGAYYGNLRVALRRKRDEQLFGAKDYRVGADIPAGAARADFTPVGRDAGGPVHQPEGGGGLRGHRGVQAERRRHGGPQAGEETPQAAAE